MWSQTKTATITAYVIVALLLQIAIVNSQGVQFAIKDRFFDQFSQSIPSSYYDNWDGYEVDPHYFGNQWASINITSTKITLANKGHETFAVTGPKPGNSTFGFNMTGAYINVEANYTLNVLGSENSGNIHILAKKIDIDLEIEITKDGIGKNKVPTLNIKSFDAGFDRPGSYVKTTGFFQSWMFSWLFYLGEIRYLQGYVLGLVCNQVAEKGLGQVTIGDHVGWDMSLQSKPTMDKDGMFQMGFNNTLFLEDPETSKRHYAIASRQKITLTDFQENMDTDFAVAIKLDIINSALKKLYRANKTISLTNYYHFDHYCDTGFVQLLPNMDYDENCKVGTDPYPVDLFVSLPTEPHGAYIDEDNQQVVLSLDSFRLRAERLSDGRPLMDFILKDVQLNVSLTLDGMVQIQYDHSIKFSDVQLVERGIMVKSEGDIWQAYKMLDKGFDMIPKQNFSLRYVLGIVNRYAGIRFDAETEAIYIGFTPDPVFVGYNQHM